MAAIDIQNIIYFFHRASYEEVNRTDPFPSVGVPWNNSLIQKIDEEVRETRDRTYIPRHWPLARNKLERSFISFIVSLLRID